MEPRVEGGGHGGSVTPVPTPGSSALPLQKVTLHGRGRRATRERTSKVVSSASLPRGSPCQSRGQAKRKDRGLG